MQLANANQIVSPYHIYPGRTLKVPRLPGEVAARVAGHTIDLNTSNDASRSSAGNLLANELHISHSRDENGHPRHDAVSYRHAPWMAVAQKEVQAQIRRRGGALSAQHIAAYFKETSYQPANAEAEAEAYCAAFVNWCLARAGFEGNRSARAASFKTYGRPTKNNKPAYGAICVVRFPGSGQHHVAFCAGAARSTQSGRRIATRGGNQGRANEVSNSAVPESWIVGFRFPLGYVESDDDYDLKSEEVDGSTMSAASTR